MIRFADFEVSVADRQLRRGGRPLVLRERAFDVLLALIEQAGQVVTKRELCRRAWPEREVEENNLQVEILGLRKLLGTNAIVAAPGRGYQFALHVETASIAAMLKPDPVLIGRDDDVRALEGLLAAGVLVTLTGEGGIGKSMLAGALAKRRKARTPGSTQVVALDQAQAHDQVWRAIADALTLPFEAGRAGPRGLCEALRERTLLLVLDGCERSVQAVAELASTILGECAGISLLATSREALRVPGERVYRLGALSLESDTDAAPGQECDAVRMFRQSEPKRGSTVAGRDSGRDAIFDICRRLEGNPLAIKLAAQRAGELGVEVLQRRLGKPLDLLTDASQDVPRRQQSLRASLDWSCESLSKVEQRVFCEAALLPQPFTLEQFLARQRRTEQEPWEAMEALARLADKSLVAVDSADPPHYRLPQTARLYAGEIEKASVRESTTEP